MARVRSALPMPEPPVASVVFATKDRSARLRDLLDALRAQTAGSERFEVVAVDDGSRDQTRAVLAEAAAAGDLRLQVIRHESSRGPAAARNAGWRAASGPLIAFTDDDCRPEPQWLEAGLAAWQGDPDRFVQGITEPDPREAHLLGPFSRTLRVTRLGPHYQTCNVFYPRALLERLGGFDQEAFPGLSAEDQDLAWRCLDAGATAVLAPDARVLHAVHRVGALGRLRVAWRWHEAVQVYARHPARRGELTYRVFWKKTHYLIVRALLGFLLPRPLRLLRFWFFAPLAPAYLQRARHEGGPPWLAPYFVLHDAVETVAVVRGALRYRTPVI